MGVCSVHQGPGLTNTMTGLTEAAKSRTPLVLLAARHGRLGDPLEFSHRPGPAGHARSAPSPSGSTARRRPSPMPLRALRRAQVERRPVVLMLPLDIQAAECPDGIDAAGRAAASCGRPARRMASVVEAADALARAEATADHRRPRRREWPARASRSSGWPSVLGGLLATSAVANGLFAGNPWSLGISGGFASPAAAELIAEADVVLGAGAGLNMWTTRHGRLLQSACDGHPDRPRSGRDRRRIIASTWPWLATWPRPRWR